MIFMNMEYPGKNYRVQVYDAWLGEEFAPMDNPKDGDKIVYRIIGENGQPVEQKTEVYQNGAWVEQGGGGATTVTVIEGTFTAAERQGMYQADLSAAVQIPSYQVPDALDIEFDGETYSGVTWTSFSGGKMWGATFTGSGFDWTDYPFAIFYDGVAGWTLITETSGDHELNVTYTEESANYETAHVEVTLSSVGGGVLAIPTLESGNGDLIGYFQIASGQPGPLSFYVLMKDGYSCGAYISSSGTVTSTGSVHVDAIDGGYFIEVEGDGTLSISG